MLARASKGFTASGTTAFQTTGDRLRVDIALQGLETLERGATYEAWLAEPERGLVSLGRFRPDTSGRAEVGFTAEPPLGRYSWLWVTAEPDARDPAHDGPTVVRERIPGDW
jgi:anti-sigma-K factor RskA